MAKVRACLKETSYEDCIRTLNENSFNGAKWTQGGELDEGPSPAWRDDRGGSPGGGAAESPYICQLVGALSGGCERLGLKARSLWAALLLIRARPAALPGTPNRCSPSINQVKSRNKIGVDVPWLLLIKPCLTAQIALRP